MEKGNAPSFINGLMLTCSGYSEMFLSLVFHFERFCTKCEFDVLLQIKYVGVWQRCIVWRLLKIVQDETPMGVVLYFVHVFVGGVSVIRTLSTVAGVHESICCVYTKWTGCGRWRCKKVRLQEPRTGKIVFPLICDWKTEGYGVCWLWPYGSAFLVPSVMTFWFWMQK